MSISMVDLEGLVKELQSRVTIVQATDYINNKGTVYNTKHLNNKPLSYYMCQGSCSWSCSSSTSATAIAALTKK